jgi:hypothetical protein
LCLGQHRRIETYQESRPVSQRTEGASTHYGFGFVVASRHSMEETAMKIEGRCHCGKITYEAEVDPHMVSICHCADCQMLTGSVYRANVPAPAESFVLRTGQPLDLR